MSALLRNLNLDPARLKPLPRHLKPKKKERAAVDQETLNKRLQEILKQRFVPYETITTLIRDTIISFEQHFADGETNPKWLHARLDVMTGSILAGIVGWSPWSDQIRTLMEKLWRKFRGNAATQYGTDNEPNAQNATEAYYKSLNGTVNPYNADEIQISASIHEVGLVRSIAFVFAGMSPDGILTRTYRNTKTNELRTQRQLLEFKCPYKRRGVTDHWPAYDLYDKYPIPNVPGQKPSNQEIPVCQYYYTQLMWGGLLMGRHRLKPILDKCPEMAKFMEPHLDNAIAQSCGETLDDAMCGEDLIDAEHPILFIVWVPCTDVRGQIDVPEVYAEHAPSNSRHVRTKFGAIQITDVEYNHDFAVWMLEEVYKFWRFKYMPRMVMKEMGVLLQNELDVPVDLESTDEEK